MFCLKPGQLKLNDIRYLLVSDEFLMLSTDSITAINKAFGKVCDCIQSQQTIYGINTGFGKLAEVSIPQEDLKSLQNKLILSHAVGVGDFLDKDIVKLILLLKINSLACGYSGVSLDLIQMLIAIYNAKIFPLIPAQGSVGASGDLAPLAHLSLVLLGLGEVIYQNKIMPAAQALKLANISVYELKEKEGLSLINGTQVSTAIAVYALLHTQRNFVNATWIGAMSFDAMGGNKDAYHIDIARVKNGIGQLKFTEVLNELLIDSQLSLNNGLKRRVQDPYSLRCQPQVMGAILSYLYDIEKHLIQEANSVSDNPIITERFLSGGNFHAEITAFSADFLAIIGSEIGAISERRVALLLDEHYSGLPAFLVQNSGLNSGFMILQVTAAALASENKTYAHPASVDSIPTSALQEDHVSMATFAGMKSLKLAENVHQILVIECLAACQGLDFRKPLKTSASLEQLKLGIREKVKFYQEDRYLKEDMKYVAWFLKQSSTYGAIYAKFFE
jgi:histidine ammonia-lyase